MNRADIRTTLDQFIVSEEFRVAALAGSWGVGKTHLWREYAQALMPQTQAQAHAPTTADSTLTLPTTLNGIAYASLFGASSLGDLRARVAEGLVLAHTRAAIVERYRARIESSLIAPMIRRARSRLAGLPAWLGLAQRFREEGLIGLIGASGYWFVRDVLVALDDLERCPGIELVTLMGFADELRGRGCKVVLITNRDKLDDEQQRFYWERVVDCDLELAPDADENSRIVFGDAFAPAGFAETARATLKALACNNIRCKRGWIETARQHRARLATKRLAGHSVAFTVEPHLRSAKREC